MRKWIASALAHSRAWSCARMPSPFTDYRNDLSPPPLLSRGHRFARARRAGATVRRRLVALSPADTADAKRIPHRLGPSGSEILATACRLSNHRDAGSSEERDT